MRPKNLGLDADKQDMDVAYEELNLYQSACLDNQLRTRIRAAVPLASYKRLLSEVMNKQVNTSTKGSFLQFGCLKAMIDGSLGTKTASFIDDYSDQPGYKGHLIWDPAILENYILEATKEGLQVCVHAIGDHANNTQLNIFENVLNKCNANSCKGENCSDRDLRFRIEHAQHIQPSDIPRFGSLGIIASMQMSHLAEDGRWAGSVIGSKR